MDIAGGNFHITDYSPAQENATPITTATGYPIDITTDADDPADTRNGSTPDMGYDENTNAVSTNDFFTKVKTSDDPLEWEWRVPVSTDIIQSYYYRRSDIYEFEWLQFEPSSGRDIIKRPLQRMLRIGYGSQSRREA